MADAWPRFEQAVKRRVLARLEGAMARPVRSRDEFLASPPPRSILVVRQHDQIGDFLLATPVLRALRSRWPDARIGIVVRRYFEGAIRHHPHVDEVLVFPEALRAWTPRRTREVRAFLGGGWDLSVVLNTVSHSITSDLIARESGARFILGSEHRVFAGCRRNFLYDLAAPYHPEAVRHESHRNLDIVRHVGADTPDLTEEMRILPREHEEAAARLGAPGPVIGIHPGAGKVANRWPVERFAALADRLHATLGARIVLFWGPGEAELADAFRARVKAPVSPVPPGGVRELAAAFTACDLMLVNDTGVMHLAAACGVPLVAIFGPTDPARWKPWGERFVAVRAPSERTADVTVEAAADAAARLLPDASGRRLP